MKVTSLPLDGAYLIDPDIHADERGTFARLWEPATFALDWPSGTSHVSLSTNPIQGTLRGLHFQEAPMEEAKVVTCIRGTMWDVIVDIRHDSPTYLKWHGQLLRGGELRSIVVSPGFAHGFLTLTPDVTVLYQISTPYAPKLARGIRWNDPRVGIRWPAEPVLIAERDRGYPDFRV